MSKGKYINRTTLLPQGGLVKEASFKIEQNYYLKGVSKEILGSNKITTSRGVSKGKYINRTTLLPQGGLVKEVSFKTEQNYYLKGGE